MDYLNVISQFLSWASLVVSDSSLGNVHAGLTLNSVFVKLVHIPINNILIGQ
jgi:hypothetical protein